MATQIVYKMVTIAGRHVYTGVSMVETFQIQGATPIIPMNWSLIEPPTVGENEIAEWHPLTETYTTEVYFVGTPYYEMDGSERSVELVGEVVPTDSLPTAPPGEYYVHDGDGSDWYLSSDYVALKGAAVRAERDKYLDATDKLVSVPDFTVDGAILTTTQRSELTAWRLALRQMPDAPDWPDTDWPEPAQWLQDLALLEGYALPLTWI